MRYVEAKRKEEQETFAYRIYLSDSLYYQAQNQRLSQRYIEIIKPKTVDTRSGDEIALDVISRLGLKVNTE